MSRHTMPAAEFELGDFQLLEELFRSASGAVFKAKHRRSRAVYVLKQRMCAELGARKDMLNEARLLQQMRHPNVVRCFGHFFDDSRTLLYMVLEYAGGGDVYHEILRRRSRREHFSEADIWRLFRDIAIGVQHLHENGIIHRDIKALNILLTSDRKSAKIADLGVSRQVSEETLMLHSFYGTPLYASPEMCENKPYNEKTDIWSLGVVLYEMATLYPPFKSKNLVGLALKIKEGNYEPLPPMYSPQLCQLVSALLQNSPEKRPSISDVVNFVSHVRLQVQAPPRTAEPSTTKPRDAKVPHQRHFERANDENSVDTDADTEEDEPPSPLSTSPPAPPNCPAGYGELKELVAAPCGAETLPEPDDDKSVDSLEQIQGAACNAPTDEAKAVENCTNDHNHERKPAPICTPTELPTSRRTQALIERHRRTLKKLVQASELHDGKDRATRAKIEAVQALIDALENGVDLLSESPTHKAQHHQQQHSGSPSKVRRRSDRSHGDPPKAGLGRAEAPRTPTSALPASSQRHRPLDAQSKQHIAIQAGLWASPSGQFRPQTSDEKRAAVFRERRPQSASSYNIISGQWQQR